MSMLRVVNRTRHTVLADRGHVATTWRARLVGLLGRKSLAPGDALLLRGEQAIHTFGMQFPIDVVYLDRDARVLCALDSLVPARLGPFLRQARDVLELPAGTLVATQTQAGDQLELDPSP